jgi:hypothetical protein
MKCTYKVDFSLCTCKCVEERRMGETHACTRLASPGQVGWGVVRRGKAMAWAHDVRYNLRLVFPINTCGHHGSRT